MVPELKERFLEMAEEDGWLTARDRQRDVEKARKMLRDGEPAEKIASWMELPIEMVKTLA